MSFESYSQLGSLEPDFLEKGYIKSFKTKRSVRKLFRKSNRLPAARPKRGQNVRLPIVQKNKKRILEKKREPQ